MNELTILRQKIEQKKGKKDYLVNQITKLNKVLKLSKRKLTIAEESQLIIQHIAKKTQDELDYHISSLSSLAMESITEEPYKLKLNFEPKRGKTECKIMFTLDGKEIDPMFGDGLGLANIAALSLRPSLMNLQNPKPRNLLLFDENLVNLKGKEAHKRACQFIKTLSDKLGIQIIYIPSQIEIHSVQQADKVFKVTKHNKVSSIKEE